MQIVGAALLRLGGSALVRQRGTQFNLSMRNILKSTARGNYCLWSDLVTREEESPIKRRRIKWKLLIENDIFITVAKSVVPSAVSRL